VNVLVPRAGRTTLRFFFRDFKTGRKLVAPISFDVKIRDERTRKFIFESPNIRAGDGVGEWVYSFPADGFYEVFLEFEKADEPGRIYRPDDWYLWIAAGRSAQGDGYYYGVIAVCGLLAAMSGMAWWSRRKGNGGKRIHGASPSQGL
jgi:hypothetical protein